MAKLYLKTSLMAIAVVLRMLTQLPDVRAQEQAVLTAQGVPVAAVAGVSARDPLHELMEAYATEYKTHIYIDAVEDVDGNFIGLRLFGTANCIGCNWPDRTYLLKDMRGGGQAVRTPRFHFTALKIKLSRAVDTGGKVLDPDKADKFALSGDFEIYPTGEVKQIIRVVKEGGKWKLYHLSWSNGQWNQMPANYLQIPSLSWQERGSPNAPSDDHAALNLPQINGRVDTSRSPAVLEHDSLDSRAASSPAL